MSDSTEEIEALVEPPASPDDPADDQSEDTAAGNPTEKTKSFSSALKTAIVAVNVALLLGVVVVAYLLDVREHQSEVPRNVTLAGADIGGLDRAGLTAAVDEVADRYRGTSLIVDDGDSMFSIPTRGIEMEVRSSETVAEALGLRRDGNPLVGFLGWAGSFVSPTEATIAVDFDRELLADAVRRGDQGRRMEAVEPSFEIDQGRLAALPGVNGRGIDPQRAGELVQDVVTHGTPLRMSLPRETLRPRFDLESAEVLAGQIESTVLSTPLATVGGGVEKALAPDVIRPWIGTRPGSTQLEMSIDAGRVGAALEELYAGTGTSPREPVWSIVDDRPGVIAGDTGRVCCANEASNTVSGALISRLDNPAVAVRPELAFRELQPRITADEIPRLAIQERIGSFTTDFQAGQPRVTNIKRISDLVRGAVIEPGETFSLNSHVGPRTTQKGFVEGGVIQDGEFAESVGGGISQFATTLFNASFFGGLDFGDYQAHTIYISRYPYGREATVSYPQPDLQIRNTTPHGVLIWPTYTDTSVTVALYSTRFATGEQTNQTTNPRGECTRVVTERTRTYNDGRKAVDSVTATYQPEEGKTC